MKRPILFGLALLVISTVNGFGAAPGLIDCWEKSDVPVFERPDDKATIGRIKCHQRVSILGMWRGYVEVQYDDRLELKGFVEARHVIMLDTPLAQNQSSTPIVVTPDTSYQTPPQDVAKPDTSYQAPPQDVAKPDASYQAPHPKVVIPVAPYETPTQDITTQDTSYKTPSQDVAKPDASSQAPAPYVAAKPYVRAESEPVYKRQTPSYAKYEAFVGFSLMKTSESDDMKELEEDEYIDKSTLLPKGFTASFTYNFTPVVGMEMSLRYNSGDIVNVNYKETGYEYEAKYKKNDFSFLFGPRFTFRADRITPFVHGLIGLSHEKVTGAEKRQDDDSGTNSYTGSHSSFGIAAGGGVDIAITNRISVRAIQADYYMADHPKQLYANEAENKPKNKLYKNMNLSFGVVFRFGK